MGNLINLAVYNPAILGDDEFLEGFVARRELTERLMNRLREITPKNIARHLLLIGQRGMGKTSMLRRLALGVAHDPALAAVLIPLTFREEQYNVHNLHVFWCNCLDALGDYLENSGRRGPAAQLDGEIGKLAAKGSDPDGTAACALFKEWCKKEDKRPLLLVDNIDLIFSGLKEQHQWGLRRILQERGGVAVVGASAGFLEATARTEAPFYDFFQVHQLEKLGQQELFFCLRQLAGKRGDAGVRVTRVLDSDPARIHTLYDLTGGNPRTLVLLYLLLELNSEGDVMDDLERLLDQVTALYKARVEDLAPQTRVVVDAVALAWNPVTVAQIAADTGLEATSISSQFDRLVKMGLLEKVSLSTPAPTGYQLGERFFNIWYLMRNASRRMRNRLRWLTEFLRRLYTPQQLTSLADDFIKKSRVHSRCSGVYGLALADALEDKTLSYAMNYHVTRLFHEQAAALREQLENFVDRGDLDQTALTMSEMKKRVLECKRDWGGTTPEEFWDLVGGSVHNSAHEKLAFASGLEDATLEQLESVVESQKKMNDSLKRELGLPDAFDQLRGALREGVIHSCNDLRHALLTVREYQTPELPLLMIMLADTENISLPTDICNPLVDALRPVFNQSGDKFNSNCYYHWGRFLTCNGYYLDAEAALRQSIAIDPTNCNAWNGMGIVLDEYLHRHDEAEHAYRAAIELDPKDAAPWYNLGNLLQDHLRRYDEAEQAYRSAIELDNEYLFPRSNLAYLLLSQPARANEAETAYREAIDLLPEHGRLLLSTFRDLAGDNFGAAMKNLARILEENHSELFTVYQDDVLRILRLAKSRGYGERLLTFLRESGLGERHWPLYAAFDAYLQGEERLRDVNPEVRVAARRIFDWLNSTPSTPDKDAPATASKKRGRTAKRLK